MQQGYGPVRVVECEVANVQHDEPEPRGRSKGGRKSDTRDLQTAESP
jgi:hypothetical protein